MAEDGAREQFALVRQATQKLKCPLFGIPGDHDRKPGNLDEFRRAIQAEPLQSFSAGQYRFIFVNSLDGSQATDFVFSSGQVDWLEGQLEASSADGLAAILFMHTYPRESQCSAPRVKQLIRNHDVLFVDMGYTHHNELANDGHTIYAATRSTGQIEEGPVGFSLTNLDDGVVSWGFKQRGVWPFAMLTFPSDRRLMTDRSRPASGMTRVRGKSWGPEPAISATLQVDGAHSIAMSFSAAKSCWECQRDTTRVSNGEHVLTFGVVDQSGRGILGKQLGPNKNGRKWD